MEWLNTPPEWRHEGSILSVVTGAETDFWTKTHYGFVHENGHFYFETVEGDFTATVKFEGGYEGQYDQAGLMLRLNERHWIKAGIEFYDQAMHISSVVTHEFSDWAMQPWHGESAAVWLRLTRKGDAAAIEASADGHRFELVRLAYFPPGEWVQVGPMCCSPTREGFRVSFEDFTIGLPIDFSA